VAAPGTGFTCGACPVGTTGHGITCTAAGCIGYDVTYILDGSLLQTENTPMNLANVNRMQHTPYANRDRFGPGTMTVRYAPNAGNTGPGNGEFQVVSLAVTVGINIAVSAFFQNATIVVDIQVNAGSAAGDMCAPATGTLAGGYHTAAGTATFGTTMRGTDVAGTIGCTGSSLICNMIPPFNNTTSDLAVMGAIGTFAANAPSTPTVPSGTRLNCGSSPNCFWMNQRALVITVPGTLNAYVQLMGTHNGAAPVCVMGTPLNLCPVTPPTP
jgi:hypothetical protein